MPPNLPTVTLRRFDVADVPMLLSMESDPEVMRYSTGVKAADDSRRHELLAWLDEPLTDIGHWVIDVNGTAVGWVSLTPLGSAGRIQLAYRLRRSAWGQGIATQASAQICSYAWQTLGVRELVAVIWPGNDASVRVVKKLGFAFAGREHHYERETDVYVLRRPNAESGLSC